jgi:SWI/SNF-related matrix-associated actin-dependent regulator 1 of chromatin subfamily A
MKLIFFRDGVVYALQRRGRILLADDMGLGKTIQALAVASAYQKDWPLLIVCPSSVRFSWRSAIFRWLPSVPEEDVIVITSGKIHNNNRLFRRITRDLFKGAIFILRKGKGWVV